MNESYHTYKRDISPMWWDVSWNESCHSSVFHVANQWVISHMSHVWMSKLHIPTRHITDTGWRRLIGSPKLQIIFYKRAIKYRSLLRKMTCKDKGSYESSPPCTMNHVAHGTNYVTCHRMMSQMNEAYHKWNKSCHNQQFWISNSAHVYIYTFFLRSIFIHIFLDSLMYVYIHI